MNHINVPPPAPPLIHAGSGPRPPHTIAVATGAGDRHLVPALMECLWLTLRDNDEAAPDYQGHSQDTRWAVRHDFGMPEDRNPYLRRAMHRRLRKIYPPNSGAARNWIPRAFLDE